MKRIFSAGFLLLLTAGIFSPAHAATFYGENPGSGTQEQQFRNGTYHVYLPPDYSPEKKCPVIVLVHVYTGIPELDPGQYFESWRQIAEERGYILLSPQIGGVIEKTDLWWQDFLKDIRVRYSAERERTFLTGFGEGGHYALHLGTSNPDAVIGVSPNAGAFKGMWEQYMNFKRGDRPDLFFVVGKEDEVVSPEDIQEAVKTLQQKGYVAEMETLENTGHEPTPEMLQKTADWFDSLL